MMFIVLYILKQLVPFDGLGRVMCLIMGTLYGIIGAIVYIITTLCLHTYDGIISTDMKKRILKKLHINR